jgi:hypothetical protein
MRRGVWLTRQTFSKRFLSLLELYMNADVLISTVHFIRFLLKGTVSRDGG